MSNEGRLIDREALRVELQQVFDARTAEVVVRVLDKVVAQVRQAGVTQEGLRELTQVVTDLAAAQRRTEERVAELAAAQRGTEEQLGALAGAHRDLVVRVEQLAEAQRRTEERVAELAAAQRRTEEQVGRLEAVVEETNRAVGRLAGAIDELRKQVGGLSETVGGDIEDIAYIVLHEVLKREFGWEVGVLERSWQTWDDEPEEVNIFGQASDPSRPGEVIWIVGEAKHNLTAGEVRRFMRQVERARQHLVGKVFSVCFCYRARPEVQQMVREAGLRLVFSYGKLV